MHKNDIIDNRNMWQCHKTSMDHSKIIDTFDTYHGTAYFFFFSSLFFLSKKLSREKHYNFHPWIPFSTNLDSLKSPQQALQDYAEKHHSPTRYYKTNGERLNLYFENRKCRIFCNWSPNEVKPILLKRGRQVLPLEMFKTSKGDFSNNWKR